MVTTLAEIRSLTRDLAQAQSEDDISNSSMNDHINDWYRLKMPSEISLNLNKQWTFATEAYISEYTVADAYRTLYGKVRVNGQSILFYTDRTSFDHDYPFNWDFESDFGQGDGIVDTFTGTLGDGYRLVPFTLTLGDGVESFTESSSGILTGELGGSGTVNHVTGAISVTFNAPPPDGNKISTSVAFYKATGTEAVLFIENKLIFRPIPNATYTVEVDYKALPTALVADSDQPTQPLWGNLIAYGTAIDILERNGSFDEATYMKSAYERVLDVVNTSDILVTSDKRPIPRW